MAKYIYPAVFTPEGQGYAINFPDIQGCYTCGDDLQDAIEMAEDVLSFSLYSLEKNHEMIPAASDPNSIEKEPNEFINYIVCDTLAYHKRSNKQPVRFLFLNFV